MANLLDKNIVYALTQARTYKARYPQRITDAEIARRVDTPVFQSMADRPPQKNAVDNRLNVGYSMYRSLVLETFPIEQTIIVISHDNQSQIVKQTINTPIID